DLRTLWALRTMIDKAPDGLDAWLRQERPAMRTEIFATVIEDLRRHIGTPDSSGSGAATDPNEPSLSDIVVGTTPRGGRPFVVAPEQLRKHTVVIGAAGSGKTVMIKRIVEQCALRGVSAIVLDPNDDLGRLGDRWPKPPEGWTSEQEFEAQ